MDQKVPLSVRWHYDHPDVLDQRLLPERTKYIHLRTPDAVAQVIRDMAVRGAPAIGITAAYGIALSSLLGRDVAGDAALLRSTRPTARDLFAALEFMLDGLELGGDPVDLAISYASSIERDCRAIGESGVELFKKGIKVLTHCNAGALASVYWGTALAPIRFAHMRGLHPFVFVDETRPLLQGSRLTAWELSLEGIDHVIIADNAAGHYMSKGQVDLILVGADRIARNGDVANKIGTYEKAVVAHENGVPFYVAAPWSTFDASLLTGDDVPIEERPQKEVLEVSGCRFAPEGSKALNPAFDITPFKYITGIVTPDGIIKPIDVENVLRKRGCLGTSD